MQKTVIALLLSMAAPMVYADDVVISTGGRGGSYFETGQQLEKVLKEFDYSTQVVKSKGSVENIERVVSGEASLGFAQIDALAWWMNRNPKLQGKVQVLGNLFQECVYIATNKKGPIGDEDDLQSKKGKIAVQKRGSGTAVTWEFMQQLEPGYAKSQTFYQGGMQALSQLATQPDGEINAFMWVSNPEKLDQRYLKTVLNNKALKLVDVDDKDLNDTFKPLNRAIYTFEKPDVSKGFLNDQEVKTICMDAVVVAGKSVDDDLVDDVADILLNNRSRLFAEE